MLVLDTPVKGEGRALIGSKGKGKAKLAEAIDTVRNG